jgi:quinol monooxygenase YgiN
MVTSSLTLHRLRPIILAHAEGRGKDGGAGAMVVVAERPLNLRWVRRTHRAGSRIPPSRTPVVEQRRTEPTPVSKGEDMTNVGLLVRLEAKPGKEADVQSFLEGGLSLVQEEPATTAWFAIRLGPSTFGIFDAFPDESGREAHLAGRVAAALMEQASELFSEPPSIEKVDVLADKLPG